MCKPKPGLRCSTHAKAAYDKAVQTLGEARQSGDATAERAALMKVSAANLEYQLTAEYRSKVEDPEEFRRLDGIAKARNRAAREINKQKKESSAFFAQQETSVSRDDSVAMAEQMDRKAKVLQERLVELLNAGGEDEGDGIAKMIGTNEAARDYWLKSGSAA